MRGRSENEVSTSTAVRGWSASTCRVASMPSSRGISRSINTTSGASSAASATASTPSAAVPTSSMSVERRDQPAEAVADHAVVVGEQHADHATGTSSTTVVPAPGAERTASVPPASATKSSNNVRPTWPSPARSARRVAVEALAVVGDGRA